MSYQIEGAIVKDHGIKYAIIVVNHDVVQHAGKNEEAINAYSHLFPDMPIILLGKDWQGKSTYYGRKDIVDFISTVDANRIPWRRYIIT